MRGGLRAMISVGTVGIVAAVQQLGTSSTNAGRPGQAYTVDRSDRAGSADRRVALEAVATTD